MHWPPFRCSAATRPVVSVLGRTEENMFPAGDSPVHQVSPPWSTVSCLCPSACLFPSPFLFYSSLSLSLSVSLPTHTLLLWVSRIETKVSRQFFSGSPDLNGCVSLGNEGLCWLAECSESLGHRSVFWCPRLTDPLRRGGRGRKAALIIGAVPRSWQQGAGPFLQRPHGRVSLAAGGLLASGLHL